LGERREGDPLQAQQLLKEEYLCRDRERVRSRIQIGRGNRRRTSSKSAKDSARAREVNSKNLARATLRAARKDPAGRAGHPMRKAAVGKGISRATREGSRPDSHGSSPKSGTGGAFNEEEKDLKKQRGGGGNRER
jgi:hypothetical protein